MEIIVPEGENSRVDLFLIHHVPGLSRRKARELIALGAVRRNGRFIRKAAIVACPVAVNPTRETPSHRKCSDQVSRRG